jgi:type I restriction enzyme S subunit
MSSRTADIYPSTALQGRWQDCRLGDVTQIVTGRTPSTADATYYGHDYLFVSPSDLGDRKYIIDSKKKLSVRGYSVARPLPAGSILFVCIGSTIGKIGITTCELTANQQINALLPHPSFSNEYFYYALVQIADKVQTLASTQAVPLVNKTQFSDFVVRMPPLKEQQRIARVLGDADELVDGLERLIAKKEEIKRGMMQQFLTGNTRLSGFTREWKSRRFADLLSYEQPGLFLVHTNTQLEHGSTPVLTAGKTFLLGYTNEASGIYRTHPVIIFDDFTTTSKFVDFDFKVKSSAIKILSARPGANLRFVYERMQLIRFPLGDHKRYWISEYSQRTIDVPELEEQEAIAQVLQDCTNDIQLLKTRLTKARAIKQGMMQELLTGRTRLPIVEEVTA